MIAHLIYISFVHLVVYGQSCNTLHLCRSDRRRAFEVQYHRLLEEGYPANRVAALLMPILVSGADAEQIAAAARTELTNPDGSVVSASPATHGAASPSLHSPNTTATPNNNAASSSDVARMFANLSISPETPPATPPASQSTSSVDVGPITVEEVRKLEELCREKKDVTPLLDYIRDHFSFSCLKRSFVADTGVPTLELDESVTATDAKATIPSEAASRTSSPAEKVASPDTAVAGAGITSNATPRPSPPPPSSSAVVTAATPLTAFLSLPPCDVDLPAALSVYTLIMNAAAGDMRVLDTFDEAVKSAVESLRKQSSQDDVARVMMILGVNPVFEDPTLQRATLSFCKYYDTLPAKTQKTISHWFATVGSGNACLVEADAVTTVALGTAAASAKFHEKDFALGKTLSPLDAPVVAIKRSVDWVQQYITVKLFQGPTAVDDIAAPVHWLKMLNEANEEYRLIHGHLAVPFTHFYNEVVSGEINLQEDFRRWMVERRGAKRATFSFCANPFILDAAAKSIILQADAELQMSEHYREALFSSLLGGDRTPFFLLKIRRSHLLEDALQGIVSPEQKSSFKRPLKVQFQGEEGVDAGGVRREFFSLITRQLFTPDFGMFVEDPATRTLWFALDPLEANIQFELVGALIGLAIYNSVILDVHFPLVVYRKLQKQTVSLRDLDDFKPDVGKNLRMLLEYEGEDFEDVFGLDFTVSYESWGVTHTVELVPGGASKPVTQTNKKAYVHAYLKWLLVDSVEKQFAAFARGFHSVTAGPALDLFRPEELARLVTGSEVLDFAALEKATQYEEPYNATHHSVKDFWSIVHTFNAEEQRKFLAFVSGSDRAPIRGLSDLRMVLQRAGPDSDRLPTASTCFYTLLLPEYASKEKMEVKLKAAIKESQGFGLM